MPHMRQSSEIETLMGDCFDDEPLRSGPDVIEGIARDQRERPFHGYSVALSGPQTQSRELAVRIIGRAADIMGLVWPIAPDESGRRTENRHVLQPGRHWCAWVRSGTESSQELLVFVRAQDRTAIAPAACQ